MAKEINVESGKRFKELRTQYGMTQKEFCEKFHFNERVCEGWEQGKRNLPDSILFMVEELIKRGFLDE